MATKTPIQNFQSFLTESKDRLLVDEETEERNCVAPLVA
jgi:hypothetical protein